MASPCGCQDFTLSTIFILTIACIFRLHLNNEGKHIFIWALPFLLCLSTVFLPLFQIELWAVSPILRVCTVNAFSHSVQCFYFTVGKPRPRKGSGQPKERKRDHGQPWGNNVLLWGCGPTSFLTQPPLPLLHHLSSTFCLLETRCHLKTHHMTLLTSAHCPNSLPAFPTGLAPGCLHLPSLASSLLFLA